MKPKKNGLTRAQAEELYMDLQRAMGNLKGSKKAAVQSAVQEQSRQSAKKSDLRMSLEMGDPMKLEEKVALEGSSYRSKFQEGSGKFGQYAAVGCIVFFALMKLTISVLEYSGAVSATPASATYQNMQMGHFNPAGLGVGASAGAQSGFSKDEVALLTSLDGRRVELEERDKRLDQKEADLDKRDREFAVRITQLKELTESLKVDREKNDVKRKNQLDQLSNVYGSMDPKEAAQLMQQLDVTIALSLLERMPEKRIGQILSLMQPDRALTITRMLSGRIS